MCVAGDAATLRHRYIGVPEARGFVVAPAGARHRSRPSGGIATGVPPLPTGVRKATALEPIAPRFPLRFDVEPTSSHRRQRVTVVCV